MKKIKINEFEKMIQTSSKPLFVIFSTTWCGVCKMNLPVLQPIISQYDNLIDFVSIDVDEENAWQEDGNEKYAINTVPTYHLYYQQKLLFKHSNFLTPESLKEQINKVLKN